MLIQEISESGQIIYQTLYPSLKRLVLFCERRFGYISVESCTPTLAKIISPHGYCYAISDRYTQHYNLRNDDSKNSPDFLFFIVRNSICVHDCCYGLPFNNVYPSLEHLIVSAAHFEYHKLNAALSNFLLKIIRVRCI
jgi:hypothetical protein